MNSDPERAGQGPSGPLQPVGPSLMARIVMRPMTKMLNPLILKLAGRPHFRTSAAVPANVHNTSRCPAQRRHRLIALTFGSQSDVGAAAPSIVNGPDRAPGDSRDRPHPLKRRRLGARAAVARRQHPCSRSPSSRSAHPAGQQQRSSLAHSAR